jgi:hypothetical protein
VWPLRMSQRTCAGGLECFPSRQSWRAGRGAWKAPELWWNHTWWVRRVCACPCILSYCYSFFRTVQMLVELAMVVILHEPEDSRKRPGRPPESASPGGCTHASKMLRCEPVCGALLSLRCREDVLALHRDRESEWGAGLQPNGE